MPNYAQAAIQLRQKKEKDRLEKEAKVQRQARQLSGQSRQSQTYGGRVNLPTHVATRDIQPFPQFSPYTGPKHHQQQHQVTTRTIRLLLEV